jgi:hypothetical protein
MPYIEDYRMAHVQSRLDKIADEHELKTRLGRVLLPHPDGTCSRPDTVYL